MKNFNNKVVVITGAASGMGRAYALAFAKHGCRLGLCDLDKEGLIETIDLVANFSDKKVFYDVFDISDETKTFEFAKKIKDEFGNTDIMINNAGIEGGKKPVWTTPTETFKKVMAVNYFGVVNGTRAFLPQLMDAKQGVLVNVSSIFGLVGTPNHADYCASKFAVRGFTEALMVELSESNIQVHLLHPGGINTNIARDDHNKDFAEHFLITPPAEIAEYLIKSIKDNKIRIVYGNKSFKTWLGVLLLPLKILNKVIWSEMKSVIDRQDYHFKNKNT